MKIAILLLMVFCFLCCTQTTKNRFTEIDSIAKNYRHEYLSEVSDNDSVFFLLVFYDDSLGNKMLINANDVEIPHFIVGTASDKIKDSDASNGYVESGRNFFFIYDLTRNSISHEFLNSVTISEELSKNKPLEKYNTNDYFLDSHTDVYNITPELNIIKDGQGSIGKENQGTGQ